MQIKHLSWKLFPLVCLCRNMHKQHFVGTPSEVVLHAHKHRESLDSFTRDAAAQTSKERRLVSASLGCQKPPLITLDHGNQYYLFST